MRLINTFTLVVFFASSVFGQTFSLQELIKISKMNVDDFDTFVTSKGFVFLKGENDKYVQGVTYALELSRYDNSKALKFIQLYQRYHDFKHTITYQTTSKSEYIDIKNQVKTSGFILDDTSVETIDGTDSNKFVYSKGKSKVKIWVTSNVYEITYQTEY